MKLPEFPRVPHFHGSKVAHDDVLLTAEEQQRFLAAELALFEKLDGINVAIAHLGAGEFVAEIRGNWRRGHRERIGRALEIYLQQQELSLRRLLGRGDVLYAEWLWHRVSIPYDRLPDLLVGFALARRGRLVPVLDALEIIGAGGLSAQAPLWTGVVGGLDELRGWVGRSRYGPRRMEGILAEQVAPRGGPRFAKWVEHGYARRRKGTLAGTFNRLARSQSAK